jgi:hypothetical protein
VDCEYALSYLILSFEKQGIDRFMNEGDNISIVLNSIELEIMKYIEHTGVIINGS